MGMGKSLILILLVISLVLIGFFLTYYGARIRKGKSALSIYNMACCLVTASIISCSLSFLAICLAFENGNTTNFYQQDVIVDIFAVLVTVLMGWNIISVVDIKRNAEKVNSISRDLEMVMSGMMQLNFHSFDIRKDREAVIDSCFETLRNVHMCENEIIRHSAETEIIKLLEELRATYGERDRVKIYTDRKDKYIFVLEQINDVYIRNITRMINGAEETEDNEGERPLAYSYNSTRAEITDFRDV